MTESLLACVSSWLQKRTAFAFTVWNDSTADNSTKVCTPELESIVTKLGPYRTVGQGWIHYLTSPHNPWCSAKVISKEIANNIGGSIKLRPDWGD